MNKKAIIVNSIMLVIGLTPLVILGFMAKESLEDMISYVLGLILGFILCMMIMGKKVYKEYLTVNRKKILRKEQLTNEELEIVKDAGKLIKKVDQNILISEFNVYKVKFINEGWFWYDENTKELCIFIPFKKFMFWGKDICFLAVVHEILHSQNLKNNVMIFDIEFLEGLNQVLTNWLIENYSEKYKIPQRACVVSLKMRKNRYLKVFGKFGVYRKQVKMVQNILRKSDVDLKEVFLNYIDINPEFFESFVPEKYFRETK